jgi:hypothetical protein
MAAPHFSKLAMFAFAEAWIDSRDGYYWGCHDGWGYLNYNLTVTYAAETFNIRVANFLGFVSPHLGWHEFKYGKVVISRDGEPEPAVMTFGRPETAGYHTGLPFDPDRL